MVIILFTAGAQYPPSLSEGPSVQIHQNPASIDTVQGTDIHVHVIVHDCFLNNVLPSNIYKYMSWYVSEYVCVCVCVCVTS